MKMKRTVGSSAEPVTKGYYSPEELATFLGLSKSTIYRLAYKRLLIAYKVNGSLRFDKNEVNDYIKAGRIGPMFLV